jgi:hypothetical protein
MSETDEIRALFQGVIPERIDEIVALVGNYSAEFRRVGDKSGFHLDAGAFGAVQFTQRSLRQLWLFGHAGMYALHCYAGLIHLAKSLKLKFDLAEIDQLSGQGSEDERFSKVINAISDLKTSESEADFKWPGGVPLPENGKSENIELGAVFDLVLMATAYVFLHELRHVIFSAEGNTPGNALEEEMQCDQFAAEVILRDVNVYAKQSGAPAEKVRMKRSMGIALGAAFLAIATPRELLAGSNTHPAVHKRWSATLASNPLEDSSYFWLYFASLAIAILKYQKIAFPAQDVESFKQLSLAAIRALEDGI